MARIIVSPRIVPARQRLPLSSKHPDGFVSHPCGSGGTGRHTIYPYRFSNSLQTYDNKPSIFRLNHFRQRPSERPVAASKPQMQAVGAKSQIGTSGSE